MDFHSICSSIYYFSLVFLFWHLFWFFAFLVCEISSYLENPFGYTKEEHHIDLELPFLCLRLSMLSLIFVLITRFFPSLLRPIYDILAYIIGLLVYPL